MGQAVSLGGHQRATAYVVQHRHSPLSAQLNQLLRLYRGGETFHPEVTGVDFQQSRGIIRDSIAVVPEIGAVGGAHIDQRCPALAQHVGHPEASADFHGLGPRHDDLFPLGQS